MGFALCLPGSSKPWKDSHCLTLRGPARESGFRTLADVESLLTLQRHQLLASLRTGSLPINTTHSGPSLPLRVAAMPGPWCCPRVSADRGAVALAPRHNPPAPSSCGNLSFKFTLQSHCLDPTWAPLVAACVSFSQGSHLSDPHNHYLQKADKNP